MKTIPLAEKLRPQTFDDIIGQDHLTKDNSPFRKMIGTGEFTSFILWGPPGCGKTTIAHIISKDERFVFQHFSAVSNGIPHLRKIIENSTGLLKSDKKFLLFIDEIHHFTKTQQDFLLPHLEDGTITLISATTENPSFQLNSALLSRINVFILYPLGSEHIEKILEKALEKKRDWLLKDIVFSDDFVEKIISLSNQDARIALNILENVSLGIKKDNIDAKDIEEFIRITTLKYDKTGEEHYNTISALHKSLRGSDVDASLYWAKRMLLSGENPLYLVRRLIRFATEDIGLADPNALILAVSVKSTYEFLGSPEGELAILELVIYLALSPKSNSVYSADSQLKKEIKRSGYLEVPYHIRNAPTDLMEDIGYGKDYEYSHDFPMAINAQSYLPARIKDKRFYRPAERGFEEKLKKRMELINKIKKDMKK